MELLTNIPMGSAQGSGAADTRLYGGADSSQCPAGTQPLWDPPWDPSQPRDVRKGTALEHKGTAPGHIRGNETVLETDRQE